MCSCKIRQTNTFIETLRTEKTCRSLLVDDTLPDTLGLDNADCDIPTSSFQAVGFGRYLRFIAKNYHGSRGVGLNFMTWTFEL